MPDRFQSVNSIDSGQKLGFSAQRRGELARAGLGPMQPVVGARAPGRDLLGAVDVVADRDRRPVGALLPGRGKRRRPGIAAVEAPGLVGALEPAAAEPAHGDVLADAQQHEIDDAVAVDVERIGAGHLVEFETALLGLELQRAARVLALR